MSFNVALSGLRAANQDLNVTGNNIANASTVGFKQSRAEFADVYANSILGSGGRSPGNGVMVADIAQQFGQGNISITNNSLDLAISGQGFFMLEDQAGSLMYTRSGIFGLDKEGYIVGNDGAKLQGFDAENGKIIEGAPASLRIETTDIEPKATEEVSLRFNLDSRTDVKRTAAENAGDPDVLIPFDKNDASTYNWSTSATVYDSLGNPLVLSTYYQKSQISDNPTATPPTSNTEWNVYFFLDGGPITPSNDPTTPFSIQFDKSGVLTGNSKFELTKPLGNGVDELSFTVDFRLSTQHGDASAVKDLKQDGFAPGRLTGVNIDDSGVIFARYTNGQSSALGKVALANFDNPQGLVPIGGTNWVESFESGQPIVGSPQTGALGAIQSGALEDSNVDLSMELVNLIIAQRNYQANAKTIETTNAVTQSIINLR